MTSDLELLGRLLSRMEDSTLDFKRDQYRLESDQKKRPLRKIYCAWQTPLEISLPIS